MTTKTREGMTWGCHVLLEKFDPDATKWARRRSGLVAPSGDQLLAMKIRPYEVIEVDPGNQLCDTSPATGVEHLMKSVFTTGTRNSVSDNTHTGLGVGSTATADAGNETGLLYASSCWNPMDATFPQIAANTGVVTLKASYATAASDFAWNEYGACIPNQTSAPTAVSTAQVTTLPTGYALLNRKAASLGTKSGGTWALTMTLTIS